MEFCGKTQIRRSARRHSESAVLKKGPFHAKLSHARQLFATTAMVLELRLSKRRSLTRQEAPRGGPAIKNALWSQKNASGTRLPQITDPASQRAPPCDTPLPEKNICCFKKTRLARGLHLQTVAPASKKQNAISCETVAPKTTFHAQGQHFEPAPGSPPGLFSYRKNPLVYINTIWEKCGATAIRSHSFP